MTREEAEVDQWNSVWPIGTTVTYMDDIGKTTNTKTRSDAQMLNKQPVIWIEGKAGCVLLDRVRFRPEYIESPSEG